jgi:hypothetical protein
MRSTHRPLSFWWQAGLLAWVATPAAAVTTVPDSDAFNLAGALAPAPGSLSSVTGNFVEVGPSVAGTGAIGTFAGGASSLGFDSGVVLSTGDVAEIVLGVASTASRDFGWAPSPDTSVLLDRVPGSGAGYFDSVRFSLTIDPGFSTSFVNFDLAYGTNEIALSTDRVGIFVNGVYYGLIEGNPIDQVHPWVRPAGSPFGFGSNLYPDGDPLAYPSMKVSLPVPSPAEILTLDFVLADVTDGEIDSALFVGNLQGSEEPQGLRLGQVPEPPVLPLVLGGLAAMGTLLRRR